MPTAELKPPALVKPAGSVARGKRAAATDAVLVQRARAGDERSFETIFKRHHAPLLSYCRHMLANRDEAEDALQQTFIRAHKALLGETPPRELRPWLYAIARNCCLSAIAARRSTDELDERTPSLGGLSEKVHEREELRELVADIARLPEDQRSALLLSELDDLSHRAIATVVGCPVSKVKALVFQARSTLIADREARGASCRDIREQLSVARGAELRRGPLRRHVRLCAGCREFQLAVEAQRQSLAIVLPVLPSAALAARILGHGFLHAAGAAGVGQAGASIAPATGGAAAAGGTAATGTTTASAGLGAAGTSAAASGGTGIAAAGGAAAGTATTAGATVASGTSAGAWIGGGLLAKVAVGGAVAALATAGAVAIPHRPWHSSRRVAHGTLHGGTQPTSSVAATASGGAVSNAAFVSAGGLSQANGAAVEDPSTEGLRLGLSGMVSPAIGLEDAPTGAPPPQSGPNPSPLSTSGSVTAMPRGAVAAIAHRRAQARRTHLRALRHRRRLLAHRHLLKKRRLLKRSLRLKRHLLAEQRRLRKQIKRRKQVFAAKPPPVAPAAVAPTPKPARKKKTVTTSSSTSITTPATKGGTTTAKHKTRAPEGGVAPDTSPTPDTSPATNTSPVATGTSPDTSPASTGKTPTSRKTGKSSASGAASGTATSESGSPGANPTSGDKTGGAGRKHRPSGTTGAGNAIGEPLEENILDANRTSDQPLG